MQQVAKVNGDFKLAPHTRQAQVLGLKMRVDVVKLHLEPVQCAPRVPNKAALDGATAVRELQRPAWASFHVLVCGGGAGRFGYARRGPGAGRPPVRFPCPGRSPARARHPTHGDHRLAADPITSESWRDER